MPSTHQDAMTSLAAPRRSSSVTLPAIFLLCTLLAGCGRSPSSPSLTGLQGAVHGGQQPVSGASIQLYAVGLGGDRTASTPLLSSPVLTTAAGNFTLPGVIPCPSPYTLVYLTATGGNPGLAAGGSNPQIAEMAALGTCGSINASTFISVTEVTTVAAVYALAPFMSSPQAVGSGYSDQSILASDFNLAAELVNIATGIAPGVNLPAGASVPIQQINTIADILATCINSAGGTSGDGTSCGTFIALTTPSAATPPTDAISALLNLANNPTRNTPALYGLATPTAPFQPFDSTQPADLSVRLIEGVAPVTVTVSGPSAAIPFGQASFTATLSNPAATGTINFLDQSGATVNTFGTYTVNQGSVTLNLPYYPASSLVVTAEYSGDANFAAAISAPYPLTIEPVATATTLSPSTSLATGGSATLTATLSGLTSTGNALPTGTVVFRDSPASVSNPLFYPALIGFGDSIMTGAVASNVANGFFDLISNIGFPGSYGNNHAQGGDQAADLVNKVFLNTPLTALNADYNPASITEAGANDFLFCNAGNSGTAGCLNNYTAALLAANTWLAIPQVVPHGATPYVTKLAGQSCTPAGTWSNSTTPALTALALASSTQGSTLTCSIVSTGGPIYVSYEAADSSAGTMSVTIDGSPASTLNAFGFNGQPILTANGSARTVFGARYPVPAGTHNLIFTVTSPTATANVNSLVGIMTPPAPGLLPNGGPFVIMMGVLHQYSGTNDPLTGAYNSAVLTLANQLHSDGLNLAFADTRNAVDENTGMASYAAGIHPNDAGHLAMAQTLLPLLQPGAASAVSIASAQITGSAAQVTLNNLASGTHYIVASYQGDGNFANSSSSAVTVTVP